MPRRKKEDEWIDDLLKLGLGILALHFLGKLMEGRTKSSIKQCQYCGYELQKWARLCPRCRNTLPF